LELFVWPFESLSTKLSLQQKTFFSLFSLSPIFSVPLHPKIKKAKMSASNIQECGDQNAVDRREQRKQKILKNKEKQLASDCEFFG
jgi:hypothetical protein